MRRLISILALAGLATLTCWTAVVAETPTKIRVLLITGDDVAVHPWKEQAAATADALKTTGKFDVTVSEDLGVLDSADGLKPYQVIILTRYNNKKLPLADGAEQNLLDFVKGGKGFLVQHLASASFPSGTSSASSAAATGSWASPATGRGASSRPRWPTRIIPSPAASRTSRPTTNSTPSSPATRRSTSWSRPPRTFSKKDRAAAVFCLEYGKGRVVHNAHWGHDGPRPPGHAGRADDHRPGRRVGRHRQGEQRSRSTDDADRTRPAGPVTPEMEAVARASSLSRAGPPRRWPRGGWSSRPTRSTWPRACSRSASALPRDEDQRQHRQVGRHQRPRCELAKLLLAVRYGADTVMDLSTGEDIDAVRQRIIDAADGAGRHRADLPGGRAAGRHRRHAAAGLPRHCRAAGPAGRRLHDDPAALLREHLPLTTSGA